MEPHEMVDNSPTEVVLGSSLTAIADRNVCKILLSEALADGGALSQSLQNIAGRFGRCWTLLPPGANVTKFYEGGWYGTSSKHFYKGGTAEPVSSDSGRLVEMITVYLQSDRSSFCVFENGRALRHDPFVNRITSPLFFCGEEVFHWLTSAHSADAITETLIRAKTLPLFVGVLGRSSRVISSLFDRATVEKSFFDDVVSATDHILVGAYDGESYVVFSMATGM